MNDLLTITLSVLIGLLSVAALAVLCSRRYEIAIFLAAVSPAVSHVFINLESGDARAGETKGAYIRVGILLLIGFVGFIKYIKHRSRLRERLPFEFGLLFVFCLLAMSSTLFSVDPFSTFVHSGALVAVSGFLLGLYAWLDDRHKFDRALDALFIAVCVLTMVNLLALISGAKTAWLMTDASRFRGLSAHPSTLGSFCMVAYPVLLWKYSQNQVIRKYLVCCMVGSLALLQILTSSRGPLLAAIVGMSVWFLAVREKVRLMLFLGVIFVAGTILLGTTSLQKRFERETQRGKSITTLTGRTELWEETVNLIKKRPFLGYGYDVGGDILEASGNTSVSWVVQGGLSFHNGYIGAAVGLGLFGLSMWVVISVVPFVRSLFFRPSVHKAFAMSIMLMCFLVNFVEPTIAISGPAGMLFWVAWVMAAREASGFAASPGLRIAA